MLFHRLFYLVAMRLLMGETQDGRVPGAGRVAFADGLSNTKYGSVRTYDSPRDSSGRYRLMKRRVCGLINENLSSRSRRWNRPKMFSIDSVTLGIFLSSYSPDTSLTAANQRDVGTSSCDS